MKNFWLELKNSHSAKASRASAFFCLAPMYDVTDAAFRSMFVRYSKEAPTCEIQSRGAQRLDLARPTPLVLFTEFVSADGLMSEGRPKLLRELYYTEAERPIVAQIFGANPATIEQAVKLIKELRFDGVDINMGCPDRTIEKQGAGSALIKNPKLAQEIIASAKRGACNENGEQVIPVSVKTRLGYGKIDESWWRAILEAKPDAVTFHLRTRKELSEAEAHYEVIPQIVEIFKDSGIPVIINGDIESVEQGQELAKKYNVDGIMIGRGAFGKPWLFAGVRNATSSEPEVVFRTPAIEMRLRTALEHSKLFWKLYDGNYTPAQGWPALSWKNFAVMRKHFKAYVSGFRGATALRTKLMQTENPDEVEAIIKGFLANT